jgi:hypothetical protein
MFSLSHSCSLNIKWVLLKVLMAKTQSCSARPYYTESLTVDQWVSCLEIATLPAKGIFSRFRKMSRCVVAPRKD